MSKLSYDENEFPFSEKEKEIYRQVKEIEPQISAFVMSIASSLGLDLDGFSFRLKSASSLYEKLYLRDEMTNINSVKDLCRYTIVIPTEKYTEKVNEFLNILRIYNQENISFKNTWEIDSKYVGINSAFKSGDYLYEIQFHTPESLAVKNINHKSYEKARLLPKDSIDRKNMEDEMMLASNNIIRPQNVLNINTDNNIYNKSLMEYTDANEKYPIKANLILAYMEKQFPDENNLHIIWGLKNNKEFLFSKKQIEKILSGNVTPKELKEIIDYENETPAQYKTTIKNRDTVL